MCGIAGIVKKDKTSPDRDQLERMSGALAHRGPDGRGLWSVPGAGLAHRRLAIIDLSDRGAQPMTDTSGEITVVLNGEIYNYNELKQELSADWKSESDTEIILEGYKRWGDGVIDRLRGMFAFALWDNNKKRLLLARDRIGKKPLFYTITPNGDLLFASEIKAFRGIVDLKPDWQAVRLFLGLQYVPTPQTGFQGIKQLRPGSYGVWSEHGWSLHQYNEWKINHESGYRIPNTEYRNLDEQIRSHLEEAVKIRQLTSDVPVGAFLSGGIDSAAVVAYASKYSDHPLRTFTMGFPNLHMDERTAASKIASHFGTDHMEFEARPEHLMELIDTLTDHYDVPYADSSALPVWMLARETAKQIKVVLTGDGGDEVFGGYRRYVAYAVALRASKMPGMSGLTPSIGRLISDLLKDPRFKRMAETIEALKSRPSIAYGELFTGSYFSSKGLSSLCVPEFLQQTEDANAAEFIASKMGGKWDLESALLFDLTSYLPDDLNVKMDRATMAFGLEARAPFLDQKLVSFALGLPLNQKVIHGKTKVALKRALNGIVPDEVLDGPKLGFQVPLAEWFRGPLQPLVNERCLASGSPLHTFMRPQVIEHLITENRKGADHGNRLWMLVSLSTWLSKNG
ncbi:MAG: asparagine synthase (glutamine-hydrolyzing) [Patescibacteria group bacterium]